MEEKFSSLEELYHFLIPALKTKQREMKKEKMNVTIDDIWAYFRKNVWPHKNSLMISEMVNDILNTDSFVIFNYGRRV